MSRRSRERANARPWEEPDDDQATGDASDGCGDGDEGDEECDT
jgi:hypothetical protein